MAKISTEVASKVTQALSRKVPATPLSDDRKQYSFDGLKVTFAHDLTVEAVTVNLDAGGLWYFYEDLEVYRVGPSGIIPASEEQIVAIEEKLDYTADTLNGLA